MSETKVVPGSPYPAMVCQECKRPQILPVGVTLEKFKKAIFDYERKHQPCGSDAVFVVPELPEEGGEKEE